MASGEIRAGKAFVEIGEKGLAATQQKLKSFGESFSKMGKSISDVGASLMKWSTGVLAPLGASLKLYSDMGGELLDLSKQTGMSVQALAELGYAADHSGTNIEEVAGATGKLGKKLQEAANGNKTAVGSFDDLGLSWEQLITASPDKQLEIIADRMASITNPAARTSVAMELFGKTGAKLLHCFRKVLRA